LSVNFERIFSGSDVLLQVPAAKSRLQSGDVFILDMGLKVYQWNGSGASVFEKHKVVLHRIMFNVDYMISTE